MQHLWLKVISVIVIALSYSGLVRGQACSSDDITADEWEWGITNDRIDASFKGTLAEYRMRNTVSITTEINGFNWKYIDAVLENDVLRIFTTDEFANYEERETALQIQLRITLQCKTFSSTKRIVFHQGLNSANNHAPVFSESEYTISVNLPLARGFDLTFFKNVQARDIDLEHNRVHFHSPASDFIDVGTSERIGNDKKTFFATLVLNQQLLTLAPNFSFTIIATDSGIHFNRSATAMIHIVADPYFTYIPVPRFEKPIYRGNISMTGQFSCEVPTIEEDSYLGELNYTLSGDHGHLFSVTAASRPYSVLVTLKGPIDAENFIGKTYFTAIISANHPVVLSGTTVLLIDIPNNPSLIDPRPTFEKSLIIGSINAESELFVETIVLSASSLETTFSMIGDDSSAFILTNEQNVVVIKLKNPLDYEELLTRFFYSFVVAATNPVSGVAETAVLISLPPKICEGLQ